MKMIRRITDSDIIGGTSEMIDTISRYASRGVLLDNGTNAAMMYMSKLNLYKLPGGGIDLGETREEAFLREIKEETGYDAEIITELGYIEEHKKKNHFFQFSYCYMARIRGSANAVNLSESELKSGMSVRWMTLEKAIELMRETSTSCSDYSDKFMIFRDKAILETAHDALN